MQRLILAAVAIVLLTGTILPGPAAAQNPKSKYEFEMYHVAIISRGANWQPYGTEEATAAQQTLMANIEKFGKAGTLVSAGIVNDDTAVELIFIFRTLTYNEVLVMFQKAPNVANGFYKADFFPWFAPKGLNLPPPTRDTAPAPTQGG